MRTAQWLCLIAAVALLAGGCDKWKRPDRNESLRQAARWGDVGQVRRLLVRGANVNARDDEGNTALHGAAWEGHYVVVQLLIARGADVNALNESGQTPVTLAMKGNHRPLVEFLIAVGAEPTLCLAAYLGDVEMAKRLIAAGADVSAKQGGRTALHYAAARDRREITELLLAAGANTRAEGADGETPLHIAASSGSIELAQLLVAKGADLNTRGGVRSNAAGVRCAEGSGGHG